jgi:hypothetical protein
MRIVCTYSNGAMPVASLKRRWKDRCGRPLIRTIAATGAGSA